MDNDQVIQLLKDYRSYKYAVSNLNTADNNHLRDLSRMPYIYTERMAKSKPNQWDYTRYKRIVDMIDGAIAEVLSDDQRTVIMRKYIDRNNLNLNEIANMINKERSSVSRLHTESIRKLALALIPLSYDESEITNIDHMFTGKVG